MTFPKMFLCFRIDLKHEGYEVLTAYDGKTGINKAISELPDLILLDVMMPEMTGIEVCKILVNNPSTEIFR